MIDACPEIAGENVVLVPLVAAHAEVLFPVFSDPSLWEFIESGPPTSLDALRERYRLLEHGLGPDGARWLNWAVRRRSDEQIVGHVQATVRGDEAEIAYVLGRAAWGCGLAHESAVLMLGFLRDHLGVRALSATIDSRNAASLRLIDRLGFTLTDHSDPSNVRFDRELS